jgi:peptidoglycan/LPS O-acetylase OafA/YrhL
MLEKMVGLVTYSYNSYGSGQLDDILNSLYNNGLMTLLLPFLLIFSLVFGILSQIKIFKENKAINPIIALVIALIAIRFSYVTDFFAEIFPRMAIGLSVILVVIILLGIFAPHNKGWMTYAMLGIGLIILGIVLVQTAGSLGWSAGYWWYDNWPLIVGAIFILVIIAVIVSSSTTPTEAESIFSKLLKQGAT